MALRCFLTWDAPNVKMALSVMVSVMSGQLVAKMMRCPRPFVAARSFLGAGGRHCSKPNQWEGHYLSTTHTTFVAGFSAREKGKASAPNPNRVRGAKKASRRKRKLGLRDVALPTGERAAGLDDDGGEAHV